jgi:hypothetical protein
MWLQPDVFSIVVLHPGHGFTCKPSMAPFAAVHSSQQKPVSSGSSVAQTWCSIGMAAHQHAIRF